MTTHLTLDQLHAGLVDVRQSPGNLGVLRAIVIRPSEDQRTSLEVCEVSPTGGVHGDQWVAGNGLTTEDGDAHPHAQVAIMNARAIELIAKSKITRSTYRWALAGDNLFVDIDLSDDNLPCGQRLAIGSAVLEITPQAHNGCAKFSKRFGSDALKFVNSPIGRSLHLRGIYAQVIQAGTVRVDDPVRKL
jgi:MOSC domain-containing protein YiiM